MNSLRGGLCTRDTTGTWQIVVEFFFKREAKSYTDSLYCYGEEEEQKLNQKLDYGYKIVLPSIWRAAEYATPKYALRHMDDFELKAIENQPTQAKLQKQGTRFSSVK